GRAPSLRQLAIAPQNAFANLWTRELQRRSRPRLLFSRAPLGRSRNLLFRSRPHQQRPGEISRCLVPRQCFACEAIKVRSRDAHPSSPNPRAGLFLLCGETGVLARPPQPKGPEDGGRVLTRRVPNPNVVPSPLP